MWTPLLIVQSRFVLGPVKIIGKFVESISEGALVLLWPQRLDCPQIPDGSRIFLTVAGLFATRRQRDWQIYLIEIRNVITDI